MSENWQQAAEAALGQKIVSKRSLSGGDFATAYAAELASGERLFIKTHQNPPACFFSTEATGLGWLQDTNTVNIPRVLAVSDESPFLAMEWVEVGSANRRTEESLGQDLAAMHRVCQAEFGRIDQRTTGSLAVPNQRVDRWADFYASQRLQPLATIARQRQALPSSECDALLAIADQLQNCCIANDQPSLLHGDLWAGNRLVDSAGESWLIDPAAHCGHREFDLSMMLLFGGYSERCFAAYQESYPLESDFQERVSLHQLAPLVVHAIKFGDGYRAAVSKAIAESQRLLA